MVGKYITAPHDWVPLTNGGQINLTQAEFLWSSGFGGVALFRTRLGQDIVQVPTGAVQQVAGIGFYQPALFTAVSVTEAVWWLLDNGVKPRTARRLFPTRVRQQVQEALQEFDQARRSKER